MKLLLDECLDRNVAGLIGGDVSHVVQEGWASIKNGQLLKRENEKFDVLLTIDKNMPYQQSLKGLKICVVLMDVKSSSLDEIALFLPQLQELSLKVAPGQFIMLRRPVGI